MDVEAPSKGQGKNHHDKRVSSSTLNTFFRTTKWISFLAGCFFCFLTIRISEVLTVTIKVKVRTPTPTPTPTRTPAHDETKEAPTAHTAHTCADVDESTRMASLACPPGHHIEEILFASFGTPTGDCSSSSSSTSYRNDACHAKASLEVVRNRCIHEESCNVIARIGHYGPDPCDNVLKRLLVQAVCSNKATGQTDTEDNHMVWHTCQLDSLYNESSKFTTKPSEKSSFHSFETIDLTDPSYYLGHCAEGTRDAFSACTGPLSHIKLYTGLDIAETESQSNLNFTSLDDNTLVQQPYAPHGFQGHIFAIPDAYVDMWGHVFDFTGKRYLTGRCADNEENVTYPIEFTYKPSLTIDIPEPVISVVIPWSFVYGHEVIEICGALLALKPLLDSCSEWNLILFEKLTHKKLFPLWEAAGIDLSKMKVISLQSSRAIVHARWIVVPNFPCLYISQSSVEKLRQGVLRLPFPIEAPSASSLSSSPSIKTGQIVLYDRREGDGRGRRVMEGPLIEEALNRRYGNIVKILHGDAPLETTISLMRTASVFISVHTSATANMIFMRPNTLYIEISPRFFNADVFLSLAHSLGMNSYDYTAIDGSIEEDVHLNLTNFLSKTLPIVDKYVTPLP